MEDFDKKKSVAISDNPDGISQFNESYASFNRIVNSLQRKYIRLEDEFGSQNQELVEANKKLVRLTERNLRATTFLNSILQSISVGVVAVDRNGSITHFNPAASMILGIPRGESVGRLYRDLIPPGEPAEANALRAIETGHEIDGIEKQIKLEDGTVLNLSVSTAILRDDAGTPTGAVETFSDLTRLKRMEQELARLNTMAAIGEMAATIAHEVRNPLAGIGGFAGLLERDLDDDDPRKKIVRKIIGGVDTINETITSLLNYSRFDEMGRSEVEYGGYLKSLVEQFHRNNPDRARQTKLLLHTPDNPAEGVFGLNLDPVLFRQVLFNIFTNAIEACRGEGQIDIRFRRLPRRDAVSQHSDKMLLAIDETLVETTIADTGTGIDPEHLDHIFAPFYTTRGGGNGLGLAVAWKIVKRHRGEIFARNAEEGGAVFHILLPAKIDPEEVEPDE